MNSRPGNGSEQTRFYYNANKGFQRFHIPRNDNLSPKQRKRTEREVSNYCKFAIDEANNWDLLIPKTVYPPREDTELLAKAIIALEKRGGLAVEIGCGSGAISLLLSNLGWNVVACDVNPFAVAAARGNIANYGMQEMVEIKEGGIGEGFEIPREAELIVWNLPYISPGCDTNLPASMELLENAAMIDIESGWGAKLLEEIEKGDNSNTDRLCLVVFRTEPSSSSTPEQWTENGWSARTLKFVRLGDERLEIIALWKTGRGVAPKEIKNCTSTMDEAYGLPDSRWSRVIAESQSEGRGRRGSEWFSHEGDMVATWHLGSQVLSRLTPGLLQICIGSVVAKSIEADVKWPNDILAPDGRKIGGVLVESREGAGIVIGIGLNRVSFVKGGVSAAGWNDTIGDVSAKEIFRRIDCELSSFFEDNGWTKMPSESEIMEFSWRSLSRILSKGVTLENDGLSYRPIGISSDGEIEAIGDNGTVSLADLDTVSWKI